MYIEDLKELTFLTPSDEFLNIILDALKLNNTFNAKIESIGLVNADQIRIKITTQK
jgi:hypothetical protein